MGVCYVSGCPGDITMDGIIHALYVNVKFSRGEEEIREGKGVTQEAAKKRLKMARVIWAPTALDD